MFGWFKRMAVRQGLFNIEINTRTLILASNEADSAIQCTHSVNPQHVAKVSSAQESLLRDIEIARANDTTADAIRARIEVAKTKEPMTEGAEKAINHVLSYMDAEIRGQE